MFEAYQHRGDVERLGRMFSSALASAGLLAGVFGAVAWVSSRPAEVAAPKVVDLQFRAPPKVEPKPPPKVVPPKPRPKVEAPKPVVAAAAPMEAPREVPKERPKEAKAEEAVPAKFLQVGGTGDGSTNAPPPAEPDPEDSPAPAVVGAAGGGPVNLPEDGEPADCTENEPPEYPEEARATGRESRVVLKVVVERDGSIGRIQVMKGEEPFTAVALAAIRSWRCEPASLEGQPLSVFKVINIPFVLRND